MGIRPVPLDMSLPWPQLSALQIPFETLGDLVTLAGTLLLVVMLVALGTFAYRSLTGEGIRWPDEVEAENDGVSRRPDSEDDDEDEWKYY